MKLSDQQKERLKQLNNAGVLQTLLEELISDTNLAWQRAQTKDAREEQWHLTKALKKLRTKFEILFKEAEKP